LNKLTLSRGPDLDINECAENVGGRFNLVLIGAARARELIQEQRKTEDRSYLQPVVTALKEIQAGDIGREYLARVPG